WALLLIATEPRRRKLFLVLNRIGSFTPLAYSFNVLFIAVYFFSSASFVLAQRGLLDFRSETHGALLPGRISDFYLWHFFDAVSVLDVPRTLHWSVPLTYNSANVGLLLLLFKLTVIIPVIAAFASYWKFRAQQTPIQPAFQRT